MQLSLFPTCGSEASRAKISLLRECEKATGSEEDILASFMSLLDWLERQSPEFLLSRTFRASSVRIADGVLGCSSKRRPNSGMLLGGVLLTADTSESPSRAKESTLSGVVETGEVPERYFLSPNAAKGILRRADRMGRNLRPHLRRSLEILAEKDR